ncbi:DUF4142 domain-containing protein [Pedobacter sp. HMF7647]|uniref:DUF4142 domain-containing protein n=1 Tax=Hufsiella arboris TaxID=2695275 RepID=A0A7K1YDP4_9SPHI|nr:DUF4142 domain-containing protein [Hufsiella arboris]MXV52724.1 DUF4142 domain-containing protein [Hufsiella arboris]
MKKYLIIPLVLATICQQACNNQQKKDSVESAEAVNDSTANVKEDDSEFMTKAASGGMLEVELGKLAQEKGASSRVKNFGAMMVKDHTKAGDELQVLAKTKNVTLPQTLGKDHQDMFDKLKNEKGIDFDKEYMKMMVSDHKEDIEEFNDAAKEGKDADVKAFASKTLPVLTMHLDSAKAINDAVMKMTDNAVTSGSKKFPDH